MSEMAEKPNRGASGVARPKVLFVDDERAVRRIGQRALAQAGFEVLVAESGHQAIELYRAHGSEIELVVLDLSMPDLNGLQTFARLKTIDAGVRVVLSSGYEQTETERQLQELTPIGFIQKPYRVAKLVETIRALLDA